LLERTRSNREHGAVRLLRRVFGPEPLAQLVRVHAVSTAADACIAVSLAGSLFFGVSVDAARPRLTLYLVLTLAPFTIVTPLLGPLVDRYHRARAVFIAFTCQGRAVLALFMAVDLRNLLLYPESFGVLVLGKGYAVAKRSLTPALVPDESELVAANARMSRVGSVSGAIGGMIGAAMLQLSGSVAILRVAAILHLAAAALALRIAAPAVEEEHVEPDAPSRWMFPALLYRPVFGITGLRAATGLLTFLLAFVLKREGAPIIAFGVLALAVTLASFAGTFVSPVLRRHLVDERRILGLCTGLAAAFAVVATIGRGRVSMFVAATVLALCSSMGRHAFDSMLQRETSSETRSRAFARAETLLQLAWVAGALIPTASSMSAGWGFALVAVTLSVVTIGIFADPRWSTPTGADRRAAPP
jgi:MFS family permease